METSNGVSGVSRRDRFMLWRQRIGESPLVIASTGLILLFLVFSFVAPHFLSFYALSNMLTFASVNGIVVAGVAFLMISGEFDLSVGSNMAVVAFVFAFSLLGHVPPVVAMVLALATAAVLGLINGSVVVFTGIPSFIVTLGTLLAYRGIARSFGEGRTVRIDYAAEARPALFAVLNGYMDPINRLTDPAGNLRVSSLWFIGLVILLTIVLVRTRYGNHVFAAGGNPSAALAQGVNVKRVKLINFVISGFSAGLAAVILFAQRTTVTEVLGEGVELTAVAAAVIGGVSIGGGSGTIVGAALGILMLGVLDQGLVLTGVPNNVFRGVVGAIVILSVIVNKYVGEISS